MIWGMCRISCGLRFFLNEMIIPCESNSHAQCRACIPHMGSTLQTSHKEDLTQKPRSRKRRKDANGEHQAIKQDESSE